MQSSGARSHPTQERGLSTRPLLLTTGSILFVALVVAAGIWMRRSPSVPTQRDIPIIMKEAAGTAPLPADDPPARKAIRDSFRYLLDEEKAYDAELEVRLETPAVLGLLQPQSFAQAPEIMQVITELRELKKLEVAHLEALQRFPEVAKSNLEKAGLDAAQVQSLEKGMSAGMADGMDALANAVGAEAAWIDAVVALYQFALDNESSIRLNSNAQLEFEDEVTQTEFDRLAAQVDELARVAEDANDAYAASQQRAQRKTGIKRRDGGR